ncbi:MAG: ATP-binding domain-containing protein [Spirochaetes bacterium]|nr:ATP-binding domain-containing protein [Spirochaetota bacterium]
MAALDNSYHIFHSVTWKDSRDGECDIIIFHELKGFIALEVKGGEIKNDGVKWTSKSQKGIVHEIHNPVKQARDAVYAVRRTWEDKYGTVLPGHYSWAVCFPDCPWEKSCRTLELPEHAVLSSKGMDDVKSWVELQFADMEKNHGSKIISSIDKQRFLDLFGNTVSMKLSLNRAIVRQEEELRITDRMQDYLLDLFDDKARIGFQGAAGTGKTWIAMKKSRRLAEEGKSVLFLTYNRQVNDFVFESLEDVASITVKTFHAFAQGIIREYLKDHMVDPGCQKCFFDCINDLAKQVGENTKKESEKSSGKKEPTIDNKLNGALHFLRIIPVNMTCTDILKDHGEKLPAAVREVMKYLLPDGKGGFFEDRVPLAVMSIFEADQGIRERYHYDALIIDEAQDFHTSWCECLKYLFLQYGDRICYIFYDDNQTIFTNNEELPVTDLIASAGLEDHIFRLRDNLRNTASIHDFAVAKTGKGATARPFEIPGLKPEVATVKGDNAARSSVAAILKDLIEIHGISKDRIVILSNRNMDKSIFSEIPDAGGYNITEGSVAKGGVRFRTIHKFKGLEADVVILVAHHREQDREVRYISDELFYVGYTRAKHLLWVVNVM